MSSFIFKQLNRIEKYKPNLKSNHLLNGENPEWIEQFVEISSYLCFRNFDRNRIDEIRLSESLILRGLSDEQCLQDKNHNETIIHSLSILEQMYPSFGSEVERLAILSPLVFQFFLANFIFDFMLLIKNYLSTD